MIPNSVPPWFWNTSRDGDSTAALFVSMLQQTLLVPSFFHKRVKAWLVLVVVGGIIQSLRLEKITKII